MNNTETESETNKALYFTAMYCRDGPEEWWEAFVQFPDGDISVEHDDICRNPSEALAALRKYIRDYIIRGLI